MPWRGGVVLDRDFAELEVGRPFVLDIGLKTSVLILLSTSY